MESSYHTVINPFSSGCPILGFDLNVSEKTPTGTQVKHLLIGSRDLPWVLAGLSFCVLRWYVSGVCWRFSGLVGWADKVDC